MSARPLADGLLHLRLAPRSWVNAYVLGDVLVDAGLPWTRDALERQLAGLDVAAHALTHAHADHIGATPWLASRGLPVWIGHGDAAALESGDVDTHASRLARGVMRTLLRPRPVAVARRLVEGDVVGGFTVLEVPGHSPGSVAYFRERDRALVTGDVVWNPPLGRRRHARRPPSRLHHDAGRAEAALARLAALRPRIVAFGHGPPVHGPDAFDHLVGGGAPAEVARHDDAWSPGRSSPTSRK